MEPGGSLWLDIANKAGIRPPEDLVLKLSQYRDWLIDEAISGGGLGPDEVDRIDQRHIGDSLLFSLPIGVPDGEILDIGTGVGLPGVPLAVLYPETGFTLLDRSGRRVELVRRAVRVLGLDNVTVVQTDIEEYRTRFRTIVTRAAIPPERFRQILKKTLLPGGTAILGGSWSSQPEVDGYTTREIGSTILDQRVWILIMRQT